MSEDGVSHVVYFKTDGGSSKLYTQEYVDKKDKEIERLNNRIDKAIYMIEDLMANNLEVHKGEPIIKALKGDDVE